MAHALAFRDMAKNFQRQSDAYGRLAKSLPQGNLATDAELLAAIAAADLAVRSFNIAEGLNASADAYNQLANDAGEPA